MYLKIATVLKKKILLKLIFPNLRLTPFMTKGQDRSKDKKRNGS